MSTALPSIPDSSTGRPPANWWPWGIIAAFGVFIAGTAGLLVLACSARNDLVSADYYEQELRFQRQLDRLSRTQEIGSGASVSYEPGMRQIRICLPTAHARRGVQGRIHLYRPSAAGLDRQLDLALDAAGSQSVDTQDLRPGLWRVRVSWTVDALEYFLDTRVVIEPESPRWNNTRRHSS